MRPLRQAPIGPLLQAGFKTRFVAPLIHVSTFTWLAAGVALVVASLLAGREALLAAGGLVWISYAHGAVLNLSVARGRHFGGWLMAVIAATLAAGLFAL